MRFLLRYVLFIVLIFSTANTLAEEMFGSLRSHVIVAVDGAGTGYSINDPLVGDQVKSVLDTLYHDGDYLTMVLFYVATSSNGMNGNYCQPLLSCISPYSKNTKSEVFKVIDNYWPNIKLGNPNDSKWSLLSIANHYILSEVGNMTVESETKPRINRTYLIRVADRTYQGNNFYEEAVFLSQQNRDVNPHKVSAFTRQVEQDYYIAHLRTKMINGVLTRTNKPLFVDIFEYQPHQSYLTLPAVVKYTAQARARRIRGSKFQIDFPLDKQNNSHYQIDQILLQLCGDNIEKKTSSYNNVTNLETAQFIIDAKDITHYKFLEIKAWLGLQDGFYDCTQLCPNIDAPEFLGRNGLNVKVPILYDKEAHLFGILPFPDVLWCFYQNDQEKAAFVWDFIILMLISIAVVVFVYRVRHFVPKKTEVIFHDH